MALLQASRWPGNLRQLSNLIRTALAMADGEAWIGLEHLPDDFLDEARRCRRLAACRPRNA
jgi:transcriptional regulator of acetoin/glycerol metabolism